MQTPQKRKQQESTIQPSCNRTRNTSLESKRTPKSKTQTMIKKAESTAHIKSVSIKSTSTQLDSTHSATTIRTNTQPATQTQQALHTLQHLLGYCFKDQNLLLQALTHKSYAKGRNNERLEFLGDAVLDLLVGEYLFDKFPQYNEGKLSKMRSSLVNEKSFAIFARDYNIGALLLLSSSEEHNCGRDKDSLLSNAFEAIIGAIYKESGISRAREIIHTILTKHYPNMQFHDLELDYKTTLQEITQERFGVLPIYELLTQEGPDHKKLFTMQISINNTAYGIASGTSKKLAEQACAKIAYEALQQLKNHINTQNIHNKSKKHSAIAESKAESNTSKPRQNTATPRATQTATKRVKHDITKDKR